MAYATASDLRSKWGSEAVNLLAWDDAEQAPDETKVSGALDAAAAIIDSYIGRRYKLPAQLQPDAAILLRGFCCDLAMGQLANTPATRNDIIKEAEKAALAFLRDISEGKATLNIIPSAEAGVVIGPEESVLVDEAGDSMRRRLRRL